MSSRLQGPRHFDHSAPIASKRREILALIDKLSATQHTRARNRPPQRRSTPQPAAARSADNHESGEHFLSSAAVAALLRSMEVRIGLLEERVHKTEHRHFPSVPPLSQQRPVEPVAHTFSGVIQGQMLSDMLQLVSSNNMSGRFVVEQDEQSCELFFDEGRICHAEGLGLVGENAFFAAFAFVSGRYSFHETSELPVQRTIKSSTQFLILEALRKIDESTA